MADPLAGNVDDLWEGLPEIVVADGVEMVDENGTFT